ncbi:Uncharacterised protein [Mycobacteroides abscessus subsp. abscessus]|nr:Uncharacterised protein [Mycobacteroides abscessus subsp. abscessus]
MVCRPATADASTARERNDPKKGPNTGSARAPKMFSSFAGLPRPSPVVPTPAYTVSATATSR